MRSVYLKELAIYFTSPIFYVMAVVFALLSGVFFYNQMTSVSLLATQIAQYQLQSGVGLSDILLRPLFLDVSMLIIFIIPIVSMRLYAEERSEGTIELLFTYPLSDFAVLAGKYLAGLTVIALLMTISFMLSLMAAMIAHIDWGVVFSSYLGLFLMASAFLSMGVFASSLSKNQIIAAVLTTGMILAFWAVGWFARAIEPGLISSFLENISLVGHLPGFLKGMISLKDLTFYICFSLFFLFLSLRVIESHIWRGQS